MKRVLTLGNFDGVHTGHQRLVAAALDLAHMGGGAHVVAATFDPFPSEALGGGRVARLLTLGQRVAALKAAGAHEVRVLDATPALLGQSPTDFARSLIHDWQLVGWVEGPDFRFGAGRSGDMALLAEVAEPLGCAVRCVSQVKVPGQAGDAPVASSSLIRAWVAAGRMAEARQALGRPPMLSGVVVRGEQRGRKLGFPTANVQTHAGLLLPAEGVYAAEAQLADGQRHPAAVSIGRKVVFHDRLPEAVVEAHLLDYPGGDALYGQNMALHFLSWLRGQQKYPGPLALQAAIREDIAHTRLAVSALALPFPPPPHFPCH